MNGQSKMHAKLLKLTKVFTLMSLFMAAAATAIAQTPTCNRTVTANVVAIDQVYTYNRFGAFNPAGMMFALRRDVVPIDPSRPAGPGNAQLRPNKRPRPLVLRANEGDCLQVTFTNWLATNRDDLDHVKPANTPDRMPYFDKPPHFMPEEGEPSFDRSEFRLRKNADGTVSVVEPDGNIVDDGRVKFRPDNSTATRYASMHVNGLDLADNIGSDGSNVGNNTSSLVAPGASKVYKWYAKKQGQYFLHSMGAVTGGEADGGQVVLGLFGSVNVEPKNSKWYRSQVTAEQLKAATVGTNPNGTPRINYDVTDSTGVPVLGILNSGGEIVNADLNAIITDPVDGVLDENCTSTPNASGTCGQPFREFTVIFHDEIKTAQAFPELNLDLFHGVKDGFAINYGSSSLGAIVLANRKKVGPAAECEDCKFEEFFLESWTNGDPALLVKNDPITKKATAALFPDDPSNVHHSYLGDPVRFRNAHAGPKETHVFHLHAHQWLHEPREDGSTYLDSQTISPGQAFTYEIAYGGSGNRNLTAGDSIFHCHLYPHFAQGMWELWRVHDVFENGGADRNLPDHEIAGGTPSPAVVPLPNKPMPPMPTDAFKGYPFYIAGLAGKRAPQPPLDFAMESGQPLNGGLPRHLVRAGTFVDGKAAIEPHLLNDPVAARVLSQNGDPNLIGFARKLTTADIVLLPNDGTAAEKRAMEFHAGIGGVPVTTRYGWPAMGYQSYTATGASGYFLVNGRRPQAGAPYADPCPPSFTDGFGSTRATNTRNYRGAYIQFDMTVNRAGWHDRQARIAVLEQDVANTLSGARAPEPLFFRANSGDCITFEATNLVPNVLNLDDFQIFTPTDIIGQHIHLVKFDVTSSDGSGNGWNYEDGTFSPDEVRERIEANNAFQKATGGTQILTPKAHPRLGAGPNNAWLGAQATVQRWWADPLLNNNGTDRTIRTVFTHDHFGPSSHQHHGLYAGLVVEPIDSMWQALDGTQLGGRADGGPTSYAANIIFDTADTFDQSPSYREFNLAIADFAIVYDKNLNPINPPGRKEVGLPDILQPTPIPYPESISTSDPGTGLLNYRNEPIPLRIADQATKTQYTDARGNMANVFSSTTHGDPFTPLLEAYEGDNVQVRLIQGAQEEQHVFSLHGGKWLHEPSAPNSGYYNAQAIGISEHFEFELPPIPAVGNIGGANPTKADFLYGSFATDNLWNGMWGILREHKGLKSGLQPLPGNLRGEVSSSDPGLRTDFCPAGAPQKIFEVEAWLAKDLLAAQPNGANGIPYNNKFGLKDPAGIVFVQTPDVAAVQSGTKKLEPLVLRANAGDCINVMLYNKLPVTMPKQLSWNFMPMLVPGFNLNQVRTSNEVSLHPQLLEYDVRTSDGANVGFNDRQTVPPGGNKKYRWYAGRVDVLPDGTRKATPIEYGAINLTDYGDIMKHGSHGAIGAIVIEPKGATWTTAANSNTEAEVRSSTGALLFKEFVLLYQDDVSMLASNGNPLRNYAGDDDAEDSGAKAFNYRSEPLWARLGFLAEMSKIDHNTFNEVSELLNDVDHTNVFSSRGYNPGCGGACGDPATPVFTVAAGTKVRFRVLQPTGHPRQHAWTLHGHNWVHEPWINNSTAIFNPGVNAEPDSMTIGVQGGATARRHWNVVLPSAGGAFKVPGDYLFRSHESFEVTGGLWGILRVNAPTTSTTAPKAPSGLVAGTGIRFVALAWTDNSADEDGFRVERMDSTGVWTVIATLPANSDTYNNSGLTTGATYSYRVGAFNKIGITYSNTVTVKVQ